MDINDPVIMAQVVVEQEAERARAERAAKPLHLYQIGACTLEELTYKLLEIVEDTTL